MIRTRRQRRKTAPILRPLVVALRVRQVPSLLFAVIQNLETPSSCDSLKRPKTLPLPNTKAAGQSENGSGKVTSPPALIASK